MCMLTRWGVCSGDKTLKALLAVGGRCLSRVVRIRYDGRIIGYPGEAVFGLGPVQSAVLQSPQSGSI